MKNETHFIETKKTSAVVTLGNTDAQNIWLILHGYGQLAEHFQHEFKELDLSNNFFVFPNALNHFYLKAGKGDVGASWMTKYFRENDIQDNNIYLSKVFETFIATKLQSNTKFITFGFSQGAATLVRWLAMKDVMPHKIILWGAVFPPDMQSETYLKKLKQLEWLYFIGTEDEYISETEKQQQKDFFTHHHFNLQWIEYKGKHAIQSNILKTYLHK